MNNKKLKLSEIKLKSFVTNMSAQQVQTAKGGALTDAPQCPATGQLTAPDVCTYPRSKRICESDVICYQTNVFCTA